MYIINIIIFKKTVNKWESGCTITKKGLLNIALIDTLHISNLGKLLILLKLKK